MNVDRYVNEVRNRIFGPAAKIERLEQDLRARFEEGVARGESTASIVDQLGTPEEVATAFMEDVDLDYAGFFERVFAFAADIGAWILISLPFVTLVCFLAPVLDDPGSGAWSALVVAGLVTVGLSLLGIMIFYFPILESHFGTTVGKRLMGLKVRTEEGARIGLGAAFLRRLSFYFEILVLDSVFVPFTEKRQRAFDIVARTVVVRDPDASLGPGRYFLCLAALLIPMVLLLTLGLFMGLSQ